jgi:uncharacterized protein with PIN domain
VNLYAESSAVLAWLLDEPTAPAVRRLLGEAEVIVASDLTLIECDRVLLRAVALTSSRQRLTGKFCESRPRSSIARVSHFPVTQFGHSMPYTLQRFSSRVPQSSASDC